MNSLPMLCITTALPCFITVNAEVVGVSDSGRRLILPVSESTECYIGAFPTESPDGCAAVPVTRLIRITDCKVDGDAIADDVRVTDWRGLFEVWLSPCLLPICGRRKAESFGSVQFRYGGAPAKIELINDGEMRLVVSPESEKSSSAFAIGFGDSGILSLLDVGRERLLEARIAYQGGERLILLNGELDALLDISGDMVGVIDGYPTAICELETSAGFQRRERYEYRSGEYVPLAEEYGFFTREAVAASCDEEIALCFCESIHLRLYDNASPLVASELTQSLSIDEIAEYLGDFEFCKASPLSNTSNGFIVIGLFDEKKPVMLPRLFRFELRGGLINDIESLD